MSLMKNSKYQVSVFRFWGERFEASEKTHKNNFEELLIRSGHPQPQIWLPGRRCKENRRSRTRGGDLRENPDPPLQPRRREGGGRKIKTCGHASRKRVTSPEVSVSLRRLMILRSCVCCVLFVGRRSSSCGGSHDGHDVHRHGSLWFRRNRPGGLGRRRPHGFRVRSTAAVVASSSPSCADFQRKWKTKKVQNYTLSTRQYSRVCDDSYGTNVALFVRFMLVYQRSNCKDGHDGRHGLT